MLQVQQRYCGHDTKPIVARIQLCQGGQRLQLFQAGAFIVPQAQIL